MSMIPRPSSLRRQLTQTKSPIQRRKSPERLCGQVRLIFGKLQMWVTAICLSSEVWSVSSIVWFRMEGVSFVKEFDLNIVEGLNVFNVV